MVNQKTKSRSLKVNGTAIRYTNKAITSWGGLTVILGGYFEKIDFKAWVESNVPIQERSNNSKGIYEKVLATFLTVLSGGERFSHVMWWNSGMAAIKPVFAVDWLPKAASTLSRFWNRISRQSLSEKLLQNGRNLAAEILEWEGISEGNLNFDSSVLIRRDQSILRLGIKGRKSKKIFSTILNRIQLNDKRLKCIAVESF